MADNNSLSRYISYLLRHHPEAHGWANVDELINAINQQPNRSICFQELEEIVKNDQKPRYSFNEDKPLIRANQGHSIPVDVELEEKVPPDALYHGTATRFLESIQKEGLKPMSRLYVHLSLDREMAEGVGRRHGVAVVLQVDTGRMYQDGIKFCLSANGVWLVRSVPVEYLSL